MKRLTCGGVTKNGNNSRCNEEEQLENTRTWRPPLTPKKRRKIFFLYESVMVRVVASSGVMVSSGVVLPRPPVMSNTTGRKGKPCCGQRIRHGALPLQTGFHGIQYNYK